jgi:hypothetical protein
MIGLLFALNVGLTPANSAGLVFQNALQVEPGPINQGKVVQPRVTKSVVMREEGIKYVNHCPKGKHPIGVPYTSGGGTSIESVRDVTPYPRGRATMQGWFVSPMTLPAPGLRVVVKNTSIDGGTATAPYTDRKYEQGAKSERFVAGLADRHQQKYLAVRSGSNQLTYQIKRGDQVIESGEFVMDIGIDYQDVDDVTTIARQESSLPCQRDDGKDDDHRPYKTWDKRDRDW